MEARSTLMVFATFFDLHSDRSFRTAEHRLFSHYNGMGPLPATRSLEMNQLAANRFADEACAVRNAEFRNGLAVKFFFFLLRSGCAASARAAVTGRPRLALRRSPNLSGPLFAHADAHRLLARLSQSDAPGGSGPTPVPPGHTQRSDRLSARQHACGPSWAKSIESGQASTSKTEGALQRSCGASTLTSRATAARPRSTFQFSTSACSRRWL